MMKFGIAQMPAVLDWLAGRNLEMQWGRDGSIWRG
jgi:hypothetical protein